MRERVGYFLRRFCPSSVYAYSTKVRVPQGKVDFRKFLAAKYALSEGGSVVDGGAHIGYYTRYFSEIVSGKGTVYSFEPNPYMFALLDKYAKRAKGIVALEKALSNLEGRTSFHVQSYSLSQDSTLGKGRAGQRAVSVSVTTLDTAIPTKEKVRFIKLDVEGFEFEVLQGASSLIERCRPWVVVEYVHNEVRSDYKVVELLAKWGYQCIDLETLTPVDEVFKTDLTDVLAVPKEEAVSPFIECLSFF